MFQPKWNSELYKIIDRPGRLFLVVFFSVLGVVLYGQGKNNVFFITVLKALYKYMYISFL